MKSFLETLKTFLKPPEFPESREKTRQAFVLNALLLTLAVILLIGGGIGLIFIFEEKVITTISLVTGFIVTAISYFLLHSKKTTLASILIMTFYWLVFTARMIAGGGVSSYDIMFHLSGTIIVGLLTGINGIILYASLTFIASISMVIAQNYGIVFPQVFAYPDNTILVLFLINLGFTIVPFIMTLRSLSDSIKRANYELEERKSAEQATKQRIAEIEMLYRTGVDFSASHDLDSLLNVMYSNIEKFFSVDSFFVGIFDEISGLVNFPLFVNDGEHLEIESRNINERPGLTGNVISSGRLLYIPDLDDPEIINTLDVVASAPSKNRSFLGIPLMSKDRIIGVMSVQCSMPNAYSDDQIRLFETLSIQAANAIERALLLEQLQRELNERQKAEHSLRLERDLLTSRQEKMEKVLEMGKQIAQETDLTACLRLSHQSIQKGLGFDRVGLFLYDPEDETIDGTFGTDRDGNIEDTSWFHSKVDPDSTWRVSLNNPTGVSILEDYQKFHEGATEDEMQGVKQHVTMAAWAGDTPVALIAADNVVSNNEITHEQVEALRLLAGYIGLSIQNARFNAELEKRVKERTSQLEVAISELETFSYSVAHDLRAPIRGMRGFSQIILDEEGDKISEEARKQLQHIRVSAQTMGELIDALLDFSRLTRVEITRSETDLGLIAAAITSRLSQQYPQQVDMEIDEELVASADERLIRIVLSNLLDNAWKFTSKMPNAKVFFGKKTINGETVFYVQDNGAGFNMEYANKLFGAFQRLHRPDEFPGHGAGLAVVQRIIHRHGGKIWAEGKPGKGATFYFTLG